MSTITAALTLFLMMDPIGNAPTFAALLKNVEDRRRIGILLRENVIALVVLIFFLLVGPTLMGWLQVDPPALNIAGGVVLWIVAVQMIFPKKDGIALNPQIDDEPFIVPIAIPLIAGPSTMAVIMLMATHEPGRRLEWFIALLIAWIAGLLIHLVGSQLRNLIGVRGLNALERLMGMILLVLAIQMTLSGIEMFLYQHGISPASAA